MQVLINERNLLHIKTNMGHEVLFSYSTPVAFKPLGLLWHVTTKTHSATTTRHINYVVPLDRVDVPQDGINAMVYEL